jgi:hypothetical protein
LTGRVSLSERFAALCAGAPKQVPGDELIYRSRKPQTDGITPLKGLTALVLLSRCTATTTPEMLASNPAIQRQLPGPEIQPLNVAKWPESRPCVYCHA